MSCAHPESLVSTDWLANRLNAPTCALWINVHLPTQNKDAKTEYRHCHIQAPSFRCR
jgi:3-mercaptopyruvate sulfurtransferase SseA